MRILLSVLALPVALFALWGVGRALRRMAAAGARGAGFGSAGTAEPQGGWAVSIGLGLATLVCAGGLLNLLHIAYRPTLWVVIAAAVTVAVAEARRADFALAAMISQDAAARVEFAAASLVIGATMLFAIATQLPPGQFNYHDDLQKYFAHPVRMMETGTLAGSPLSALGSETLGGQAFLHGLVLSFAPLGYINGVDAIFGLLLLLLLAASVGWRRFGWFPGAALGALLVAVINPQYVNVSGLYLGAALMATAILLVADEREGPARPVLLGMVYGALVAVKPTFGVFAAVHGILSIPALGGGRTAGAVKHALARAAGTAAWALAAVAPWFLIHAPNYFSRGDAGEKMTRNGHELDGANLFSTERLFDGDSVVFYTALAVLAAWVALLALAAWRASGRSAEEKQRAAGLFAGAFAGVLCFPAVIYYLGLYAGYQLSVRYAAPFVLGACVIPALLAPSLAKTIPRAAAVLVPALACLAIATLFVPAAIDRFQQAENFGSILAFPPLAESPQYRAYMRSALSDEMRAKIEKLQAAIPAGAPVLAWINTPFLLDYRRNRIVDVDTAGIATPWAHVPPGIQYYLWEYQGFAVRSEGDYLYFIRTDAGERERLVAGLSLAFANRMAALASRGQVIMSDDQFVLFRVDAAK